MENEQKLQFQPGQDPQGDEARLKRPGRFTFTPLWLGIYLIVICVILTFLLYTLWPSTIKDQDGKMVFDQTWKIFCCTTWIFDEARLILIVLLAGALGSYIHAATSFVSFVGTRSLEKSWLWWYVMRPFIGAALALLFYFVIRGGFLSTGTDASAISIFGIAGLAGLVGMFSKNAIDKLREVFETLFKTEKGKGDEERGDKMLKLTLVEKTMIPLNKISSVIITEGKTLKDIALEEIYKMFKGIVTRIPVLTERNVVRYVIHQSILYKFIAQESVESSGTTNLFDFKKASLEDMLEHPEYEELIGKSFVFVKRTATIEDARKAMESVKNCQDVFVTENGRPDEPVIGWLTNIDIARNIGK